MPRNDGEEFDAYDHTIVAESAWLGTKVLKQGAGVCSGPAGYPSGTIVNHIIRSLDHPTWTQAHPRQDVAGVREPYQLKVPHPAALVFSSHCEWWLIQQRANFSIDGRNSLLAGRTRTRLNIGRPQTRWETGYETAVQMLGHRIRNECSSNTLSVGAP